MLSEPLDGCWATSGSARADATKRTFAFEVSCVSDALQGIEVAAPSRGVHHQRKLRHR